MPQKIIIGLDLDGVIIDHRPHKCKLARERGYALETWQTNTNCLKKYLPADVYEAVQEPLYTSLTPHAPPVAGALEHIAKLPYEAHIVSARRSGSTEVAREWLEKHGVFNFISPERVFFCGKSTEKGGYCHEHGINLFLDDKLEALQHLPPTIRRVLFDEDGVGGSLKIDEQFKVVKSWPEFFEILPSLIAR